MAGKKRFVAKLLVLTSVLAAGGAGAYHFTSGGGWPRLHGATGDGTTAKLLADDSRVLSDAELDAVASSWTNSATVQRDAQPAENEITPSARSAAATLSRAATTAAASPVGSRYATPAADLEDAAEGDPSVTVSKELTKAREPELAESAQESLPSAADTEFLPSKLEDHADSTLARGQDPDDEQDSAVETTTASHTSSGAEAESEPRQLTLPTSSSVADAATRRARQAFGDASAATGGVVAAGGTRTAGGAGSLGSTSPGGSRLTAGGGRYATAPPSTATATRPGPTDPGQSRDAALVNPFASQSPAGPAPVAASASPAEPREFGDALSETSGGALDGTPVGARRDYSPSEAGSSTEATLRSGSSDDRGRVTAPSGFQPTPNDVMPAGNPTSLDGGQSAAVEGTGKPGERALEGPQKPALAIQKFGPPEIQVGKPAKFAVQVRNVGTQAAEDVVIRDVVPQGTRLVSTSPQAESDGSQLAWQLGKLSVGEERTVEMQLMPTAEGEIGSVATVTHSAQASVKSRSTMPQLAIRMTAPSKVMIGSEQRVKIELRNPGSGDATGVMLFENVPANVRHAAGPALEFEVGTLPAGQTRELELVLLAEKAGKVVNVLSARADGNLQVQQQVEFEVIAPALSVEVNGPERRYLERPATYEVTVENPGTAVAHDVQLVTKLPKGMRFVRANNMGEYDATSHAVYWSLAELPEGEQGTVELVTMPIETGPQTLEVEGRAQQGLTDQAQQQIVVEGLAAIMFEVRDLEDPIEVGGETGYEVRVVNQGTKAATNVKVTINLPPGMQVVSAEGETRHAAQGGSVVFEPLASLAPKADTLYRLKVQGTQAGDQRVTVEVNTDDLGQPIRREESTRVFGDE